MFEQNLLTNSIWTYTITNIRVNQWERLANEFNSDVNSGYKDAADIQNDQLYICVFTDLALWKKLYVLSC